MGIQWTAPFGKLHPRQVGGVQEAHLDGTTYGPFEEVSAFHADARKCIGPNTGGSCCMHSGRDPALTFVGSCRRVILRIDNREILRARTSASRARPTRVCLNAWY